MLTIANWKMYKIEHTITISGYIYMAYEEMTQFRTMSKVSKLHV